MRTLVFVLIACAIGGALGLACSSYEFSGVSERFALSATDAPAAAVEVNAPHLVVEGGPKFEFGLKEQDISGEHTFVIRNEGKAALDLEFGHPSCGMCIQSDFVKDRVPPGGSCNVVIKYHTKKPGPEFYESATLTTNDPRHANLTLLITGYIQRSVRLDPPDIMLGSVSASEGAKAELRLFGYREQPVELKSYTFASSSAEFFSLEAKPMDADTLAKEKFATSGLILELTAKQGVPLGPIKQHVEITALVDKEYKLETTISGTAVGDISFIGSNKDFDPERNMVTLGIVPKDVGKKASVHLVVKGAHRDKVEIKTASIEPADLLKVSISEKSSVQGGSVFIYRVDFEIPPGVPVSNHLGNAQGAVGKIVLETTHPTDKLITIYVRFATE